MNNTPVENSDKRDYSSISPSARQLLLLKGFTKIPFVKEAAQLMLAPKEYIANLDNMDFPFKARLMHFEWRYRSMDQLLDGLPVKNVLELSSGFSFRGLDLIQHKDVFYIDTDLPEVIDTKKNFVEGLTSSNFRPVGKLEILPLNALDETQWQETIRLFPPGPVAILTEGLLMYLNPQEKLKLCGIIHRVLQERGGYWIVADIYVRKEIDLRNVMVTEALQSFYQAHRIEENKFESFDIAEKLLNSQGLVIDKVADGDYSNLDSLKPFLEAASAEQMNILKNASQVRATWRLKLAVKNNF
jgi:O-methyltransferase involved in polyketide biosynthesis